MLEKASFFGNNYIEPSKQVIFESYMAATGLEPSST